MATPHHHHHHHTTTTAPNIWAQMSYTPPRGPCSQKLSMLTTCPCHRFMIHPLKASTSFECDGCGHHASFHCLENEGEERVVRRWEAEAQAQQQQQGGGMVLIGEEEEEFGEGGMREMREMRERETVESGAKKRRRIEGVTLGGLHAAMAGTFGEDGVGDDDEPVEIGMEGGRTTVEVRRNGKLLVRERRMEAEEEEREAREEAGRKRKKKKGR